MGVLAVGMVVVAVGMLLMAARLGKVQRSLDDGGRPVMIDG